MNNKRRAKRFIMLLVVAGITFTGMFVSTGKAEAAWSGWQTRSGYTAKVYTNAAAYTTKDHSIKWRIKKRGNKKLYYKAYICKWINRGLYSAGSVSGSFKSTTPIKTFKVKSVRKKLGSGTYMVRVIVFKDSKKKKMIGSFNSKKIRITEGI
ncbi:hypothetical protein [Bacillus glycinifermentans]|uniref:Cell wall-binding protein n=1 Tax=Bacillus glycinifermentans TaxID=1664069 RepID=A0A0T6BQT9_9BACI|nr:hypothetical protein [Bacillus glycinifermentans]ATH91511.1 hypothetical protein COP00_01920 [Bacillus glycinifermentans]KRT93939.1 hypothetical protein AB447_216470 [Bacillus glycinifermentans]MEC0485160.1 hypothetical protein [Bacillus glycinifermentans]MEC0496955.1 hypothetical protein [Bacillus glycinifermentans]MEC0540061.1 hypothetical protein [Bacillus glycinifermentans]